MHEQETPAPERIRTGEVIAASCLATDLGMGFPFEHGLHATLMAMRLVDLLGLEPDTASQTYYACLLMYAGCTADADIAVRIFGGGITDSGAPTMFGSPIEGLTGLVRALPTPESPPHRRAFEIATRLPLAARHRKPHMAALCEVAVMLAERLGLPAAIHELFTYLTDRWDGKGPLKRAAGDGVPLPLRLAHVARDAAYQRLLGGDQHAADVIRRRAGRAFDPAIAERFAAEADDILAAADIPGTAWQATLAAEPRPWLTLEGAAIDRALAAMGSFADLVAPALAGHSSGVARLAVAASELCGFDAADTSLVRRAALVHDVGRVAVHPRIWQKPGALTAAEWELVRLHAYHTERVLAHVPLLAALTSIACAHHERLDGSGYHRRATAASLPPAARLLAAADAFHAMTEPRPYRHPLAPPQAAKHLVEEAGSGRHDGDMVAAVLEAAGQPLTRVVRPAGLTEREVEVVGLLARGLLTKQVARALGISAKTADRHIQNAYRKIGVSTRAGATLFAIDHGLVAWGQLPISRPQEPS